MPGVDVRVFWARIFGRMPRRCPGARGVSHTDVVRVASVPSGHVYVRHLSAVDADERVIRLPDPPTDKTGRWWPPAMLHSEWVRDHAQEFDVLHVHFGFDAQSVESLHSFVEALDAVDRPLVMTVHDLRNPHHADRRDHDAQLDVLIPAASAVLTLTPGAALEIERRWGVRAEVTPHPHVFDLADIDRPRPAHSDFVIGLHCKSVRACMDPGPVVGAILEVITDLPSARLVVDVHTDVMTPGNRNHVPQLAAQLTREAAGGRLTLHVHDYYTHERLRDYLAGLDLSVLPYRFGTHSGWAEGC